MKTIRIFLAIIFVSIIGSDLSAQTAAKSPVNTESFKVWGNCTMCKARIEKAVKEEGATTAVWDVKTKLLAVSFDPSKTSVDKISKKLASVGHDTEKYRADDKTYEALPSCCHYDRAPAHKEKQN